MNILFNNDKPKYIQIYTEISGMINNGLLKSNDKLPSKRALAIDLNVSISTIENAYLLLLDEGYIYALEKKGYFVANQKTLAIAPVKIKEIQKQKINYKYDFTTKNVEEFSNQKWKKIIKEIIDSNQYLNRTPVMGDFELREVISNHLKANRGINASPNNILITSGLECFRDIIPLCNCDTLILENPGYHKLAKIVPNLNIKYQELDQEGVIVPKSKAILYTTPFNQFPTGIKMSIGRKKELVNWAKNTNSFIIEDDFDAEFRINSNPTTSLYSLLPENVIFFSTFSTTLYPGIRISYAILPPSLNYDSKYIALSNPVSSLIQLTLKEFINKGYYTKLINNTKKRYLDKRNLIIKYLENYNIEYYKKKNYLSLLVNINRDTDSVVEELKKNGLLIEGLKSYDHYKKDNKILIIGYTSINEDCIEDGIKLILEKIK